MQNQSRARRRFTAAQREEILRAYRKSELPQSQFAAQAGISVSGLQLWLRKSAGKQPGSISKLVQIPNLLPPPSTVAAYRLHLPSGVVLEVREGFNPGDLGSLLQLAKSL